MDIRENLRMKSIIPLIGLVYLTGIFPATTTIVFLRYKRKDTCTIEDLLQAIFSWLVPIAVICVFIQQWIQSIEDKVVFDFTKKEEVNGN